MDSKDGLIRVMIVDDHAIVRSGLSAFLLAYPELKLVGEAANGAKAIELCPSFKPDVILMDLVMPVMDGIKATRVIRERHPEIQVIALTSFQEEQYIRDALQAGAIGYLLKDIAAEELANAIRSAAQGKPALSPEAARVLIQTNNQPAKPGDDLTTREREVLNLLVQGMSNQEIAARLVISTGTVKFHVSSILSKLGVASRTEAVSLTLKSKIIHS